jgi:hypothetical protein
MPDHTAQCAAQLEGAATHPLPCYSQEATAPTVSLAELSLVSLKANDQQWRLTETAERDA